MYFFQPKQKIPEGLSIVLSKVLIGDQVSDEKIVPQQLTGPYGHLGGSAGADLCNF